MKSKLTRKALFDILSCKLRACPDTRSSNLQYPLEQAGMTVFGTFYFQHGSMAAHELAMKNRKYQRNFKKIFYHSPIECSQTVRNILDPVPAESIGDIFSEVLKKFDRSGILSKLQCSKDLGVLLAGDGVDYFQSEEISCSCCSAAVHNKGKHNERTSYSHKMFNVGIVHPTEKLFFPLEAEFVTPQDGSKKQDCEQNAMKRWLAKFRGIHRQIKVTMLVDNLHADHPTFLLCQQHRVHLIAAYKDGGNKHVADWVETARSGGDVTTCTKKVRVNKRWVERTYSYLCDIPIRDTDDAIKVNYVSMEEKDLSTNRVKKFAYLTDHHVDKSTVGSIIKAGRRRWKVENESHNTLKNHGYYFDHNYGHGKQHLSTVVATLINYAFLVHSVLRLVGQDGLGKLLNTAKVRKWVMERMRNIFFILELNSWNHLYEEMAVVIDTS